MGSSEGGFVSMKRNEEEPTCLNCQSPNPLLKLARTLERAWSKMVCSRLSVPFLRPALPLLEVEKVVNEEVECTNDAVVYNHARKSSRLSLETSAVSSNSSSNSLIGGGGIRLTNTVGSAMKPGNRNSSTSSYRPTPSIRIDPTLSVDQIMLGLWRRECEQSRGSSHHTTPLSTPPRTLHGWSEFLKEGEYGSSSDFRGPASTNPYSTFPQVTLNEALCNEAQSVAKRGVSALLGENRAFSEYLESELSAAELMRGMKSSNQRETVTLFEGARTITDKHHPHYKKTTSNNITNTASSSHYFSNGVSTTSEEEVYGPYGLSVSADETLVILDRLQEVTKHAQQLETRLREDHLYKQRSIASSGGEVVTIGQVGVLRELKLANDNLRWRLQQKSSVIAANKTVIERLHTSLQTSERNLQQANEENEKLRNRTIPSIRIDPTLSVEQIMMGLWRRECEQSSDFRGLASTNPYSTFPQVTLNEALCNEAQSVAKRGVSALLGENRVFSEYLESELSAAGMKSSNQRETVTLFEGARTITDKRHTHNNRIKNTTSTTSSHYLSSGVSTTSEAEVYGPYGLSVSADETLVVLDRLQEVTRHTQQLETRLREDHLHKQRSIVSSDGEVMTIGQVGVLRELKLANDNLRWRLQQKSSVIAANKTVIERLHTSLQTSERNLQQANEENEKLRSQLAKFQQQR
eukprot:gene24595-30961_t